LTNLLGHDLKKSKDRLTFGYAPAQLESLRDTSVATLVPKPFLVAKPSQARASTVTYSVTSAVSEISEIRHAESA
jgi:hypothetical protein